MFDDYLMDQINSATRFLAKIIFNKGGSAYEFIDEDAVVSEEGFFWHTLKRLILQGEINEAENMLFERIQADPDNEQYLKVALRFYQELSGLEDAFLASHDFSRQEILEGLTEIRKIFDGK